MEAIRKPRRYELDWLRVLAFTILILFHTGMMFNTWEWHVKNSETTTSMEWLMALVHQWRMPLLFFISGGALWFALDKYPNGAFSRERLKRLLLPLAFGMLVIIPPQVYYERVFQGANFASFGEYYLSVLEFRPYPEGNFSWHHLWYIPYIFVFSFLALPFFRFLKRESGRNALQKVMAVFEKEGVLFLWFIPFAVSEIALRPFWPSNENNLLGDWAQFTTTFLIFCTGYIIVSKISLWKIIERMRWRALLIGTLSTAGLFVFWETDFQMNQWEFAAYRSLRMLNMWSWMLAILGFGRKYMQKNHPFLQYANQAVYPFYIVHQTITVILGYYLVGWNAGILLKFVVLAAGTFLGSWIVYEMIRRTNITRVLFGLKPLQAGTKLQAKPPFHEKEALNASLPLGNVG